MLSLTFCTICLLAVAAGLAVYEALNAWAGVKARGLMSAWARSDQAGGSSRGWVHAGPARLWSRAVEALAGFAPLSMRERERSRERLRCAGIALEPETWRCVCFAAVSGCVVIAVAACIAFRATPAVFVFVVCGASGLRRLAAVSAIEAPSAPRRHRCRIARRHGTAWRGDSRRISGGTVLPPSRRELERPACR